eukprot:scaffold22219_cov82-Skeletonema_dohrnii-CCMP3373.AAC.2
MHWLTPRRLRAKRCQKPKVVKVQQGHDDVCVVLGHGRGPRPAHAYDDTKSTKQQPTSNNTTALALPTSNNKSTTHHAGYGTI